MMTKKCQHVNGDTQLGLIHTHEDLLRTLLMLQKSPQSAGQTRSRRDDAALSFFSYTPAGNATLTDTRGNGLILLLSYPFEGSWGFGEAAVSEP
jgi:hypothetical protein